MQPPTMLAVSTFQQPRCHGWAGINAAIPDRLNEAQPRWDNGSSPGRRELLPRSSRLARHWIARVTTHITTAGFGRGLTGLMDFDRISGRWRRTLLTP